MLRRIKDLKKQLQYFLLYFLPYFVKYQINNLNYKLDLVVLLQEKWPIIAWKLGKLLLAWFYQPKPKQKSKWNNFLYFWSSLIQRAETTSHRITIACDARVYCTVAWGQLSEMCSMLSAWLCIVNVISHIHCILSYMYPSTRAGEMNKKCAAYSRITWSEIETRFYVVRKKPLQLMDCRRVFTLQDFTASEASWGTFSKSLF